MPSRNLKLLCLDGGGVRGLSSLFILQKLMEMIDSEKPPKPCEYFDVIGGTSTGGLIAIMLGRLEMDVEACIKWYIHLCRIIFSNKKVSPVNLKGNIQARFESGPLKKAIIEVLVQQGLREEELLRKPENRCKVFVCTTSGNSSTPILLRSYPPKRDILTLYRETKIWEAARATSAAPTFFEPISIGSTGRIFGDGATGANNPIVEMWKEAVDICEGEDLNENLCCIVSIGTGVPILKKFGTSAKEVADSVIRIATETEETANNFNHTHPELNREPRRYFRFSTPRGLGEIPLDESSEVGTIEDITAHYLKDENTYKLIQLCAKRIAENHLVPTILPVIDLTSVLILSNTVKRPEWQIALSKYKIQDDIFERLSDYDYQRVYRWRTHRKLENTTNWVLKNPAFATWLRRDGPQCLWLSGIVGCGKSIIMTTVIEETVKQSQNDGRPVLHFIYDHSYRKYLTASALFECYTKQLLGFIERSNRSCDPALVARIIEFYGPKRRRPYVRELLIEILIPLYRMVEGTGAIFLVDGVDECDPREALEVMNGLRQLLKSRSCRVFISCREEVNVLRRIPGTSRIWITAEDTKADMELFVDNEIETRQQDRLISDTKAVLDSIRQEIRNKADGMFLWVHYVTKMLWEDCTGKDAVDEVVYERLKMLPKDLDETYKLCLERATRDEKRISPAYRILKWICVSPEPFKIIELQEALAVNPDTGRMESSALNKEEVLACCANLAFLESDGFDELVLLAHHSVRKFLLPSMSESEDQAAQLELGELCVAHLNWHRPTTQDTNYSYSSSKPPTVALPIPESFASKMVARLAGVKISTSSYQASARVTFPKSPARKVHAAKEKSFYSYAKRNWMVLTGSLPDTSRNYPAFKKLALLNDQSWNIYPWQPNHQSFAPHVFALYGWSIINRHLPLLSLTICQQGSVRNEIFNLPLFDQVNQRGILPLPASAAAGDVRVVELVLKYVKEANKHYSEALHVASSKGHEAVVQLLLDKGANIEAENGDGGTALRLAAENGHADVVRLLLERGANIEAKNGTRGTALHLAAGDGHADVVQLLLEKGAYIEAKSALGSTPLHSAYSGGHLDTIKLLLKAGASRNIYTLRSHLSTIRAVAFSPDGQLLASDVGNYTVKLLDSTTAALLTLEGHSDYVNAIAFSPDGQMFASASDDHTVGLWDPTTEQALWTLEGHSSYVNAVTFSPYGKLLASASSDRTVRLWDPTTGRALWTLKGHSNWVKAVAFSPDGKLLASASDYDTIKLWDPTTGQTLWTLRGHSGWVDAVVFSPDGKLLTWTSSDCTVRLWDPTMGQALWMLEGHSGWVSAVVFSPDSKLLASASGDHTVRLWDPTTGQTLRTLDDNPNYVNTVAFSPDGKLLASTSSNGTIRLWDPATGQVLRTLKGHLGRVSAVAFSPDGQLLASVSTDRSLRLWVLLGLES